MRNIKFSNEPADQLNPTVFNAAMGVVDNAKFGVDYEIENTKLTYRKDTAANFDYQSLNTFSDLFSDGSMFYEKVITDNGDEMPISLLVKDYEQNGVVKRLIQKFSSDYSLDELNIISFVLLKKFVHFVD